MTYSKHNPQPSKPQRDADTKGPRPRFNLSVYGRQHVAILLALYTGEKCLPDQLHSFKSQTHEDWALLISDDGSADDGPALIKCYARAEKSRDVRILNGPQRGFAMNFIHLINAVDRSIPFAAFSDQDDAWLPQKLERGLDAMRDVPQGIPAVYCGRTWVCSSTLRKMRPSTLFRKTPHFSNAIVQSIGGGNTMLLNNAALNLVKDASQQVDNVTSHDWWVYQLVAGAGGKIIYDETPMVLYRQHDGNIIGASDGYVAVLSRLWMVLARRFQSWNTMNERALLKAASFLTVENRSLLFKFAALRRTHILDRIHSLRRSGIHHQTRLGNMGLWLAAFLNRI